jgi:hypothetical protein
MRHYRWLRFWRIIVRLAVIAGVWSLVAWFAEGLYTVYLVSANQQRAAVALYIVASVVAVVAVAIWGLDFWPRAEWRPPKLGLTYGENRQRLRHERKTWGDRQTRANAMRRLVRRMGKKKGLRSFKLELDDNTWLECELPPWWRVALGFIGFCLKGGRGPAAYVDHRLGEKSSDPIVLEAAWYYFGRGVLMRRVGAGNPLSEIDQDDEAGFNSEVNLLLQGKPGHGPQVVAFVRRVPRTKK